MSLLIPQSLGISLTTEDAALQQVLHDLQETIASLQLLVCELLVKNQQLRSRQAEKYLTLSN